LFRAGRLTLLLTPAAIGRARGPDAGCGPGAGRKLLLTASLLLAPLTVFAASLLAAVLLLA
jgi:hypothetical protein